MSRFARKLQQSVTRTTAPVTPSDWPDATNTGWQPTGVTLTNYTGPSTIQTNNIVIDSKTITTDLVIQASNVTIRRCQINGHIDCDNPSYSLTVEDCTIDAGPTSAPGIGYSNITVRRCNMTGGQHNILCGDNGIIEDNWLHSQYGGPVGSSYHNNAFISNGGSNILIRHNRLDCSLPDNGTGGGPTADASIFGDFATMTDVTFDNNLFMPTTGGYGGTFGYNPGKPFGSNPVNIVVTNNVFQRGSSGQCGVFGPVTSFKIGGPGHVWSNNTYEGDGEIIPPST